MNGGLNGPQCAFAARGSVKLRRKSAAGFTLLELVMVVFIMGLLLMIAMPNLGAFRGTQVRSEIRRLAGRATYLYEKAAAEKAVYRLIFHIDSGAYEVARLDPFAVEPAFLPATGPGTEPVKLPPTVAIRDVSVEGIGTFSRGSVATHFYPQGYVDATLIHLVDASGTVYTMFLNPLTGGVAVALGDYRDARQLVER